MKVLFTVQGDGRGHMTQAIALREMLQRRGDRVTGVVVGGRRSQSLPGFFEEAFEGLIHRIDSLAFCLNGARGVSTVKTAIRFFGDLPAFSRSLATLDRVIKATQPELIINFLEPLMGIYNALRPHGIPVLAVAHQFMLEHPGYTRTPKLRAQQLLLRRYIRLAGLRSTRLALSLYPGPDLPGRRLIVCPPILRRQLFALQPASGDYLLVYLLNHGYTPEIEQWHERNPGTPIHCFYNKPGAPAEESRDGALTFHRLDGEKFLRLMAGCRGVACTAGFESVSEAAYLGKSLLMVPVQNHIEQFLNAHDTSQAGLGQWDTRFALSSLLEKPDSQALSNFRQWVDQAEPIVLRAIAQAVEP